MADNEFHPALAPIAGAGPRLKAAREAAGWSVEQVSAQTKIPGRMLALIEAGDFAALPARTYATGFTRSYARALGLDEGEYVAAVRKELGLAQPAELRDAPDFAPGDPARVPTAKFAWLAAVAALVVVAAGLFFWRTYYSPAVSLPSLLPPDVAPSAAPQTSPAALPDAAAATAGPAAASTSASASASTPPPVRRPRAVSVPPSPAEAPPAPEEPVAASTAAN